MLFLQEAMGSCAVSCWMAKIERGVGICKCPSLRGGTTKQPVLKSLSGWRLLSVQKRFGVLIFPNIRFTDCFVPRNDDDRKLFVILPS